MYVRVYVYMRICTYETVAMVLVLRGTEAMRVSYYHSLHMFFLRVFVFLIEQLEAGREAGQLFLLSLVEGSKSINLTLLLGDALPLIRFGSHHLAMRMRMCVQSDTIIER